MIRAMVFQAFLAAIGLIFLWLSWFVVKGLDDCSDFSDLVVNPCADVITLTISKGFRFGAIGFFALIIALPILGYVRKKQSKERMIKVTPQD